MKKILLLMIIVIFAVPVFSEEEWEGDRTMTAFINLGPSIWGTLIEGSGIGIGFEYAPLSIFSAKSNLYFLYSKQHEEDSIIDFSDYINFSDYNVFIFRFSVEGRWYPQGNYLQGLFTNLGIQYHLLSGKRDYYEEYAETYNTFGVFYGVGYKYIFGKSRFSFAIEPSLDYVWAIFSSIPRMDVFISQFLGIKGFRANLHLGVSF